MHIMCGYMCFLLLSNYVLHVCIEPRVVNKLFLLCRWRWPRAPRSTRNLRSSTCCRKEITLGRKPSSGTWKHNVTDISTFVWMSWILFPVLLWDFMLCLSRPVVMTSDRLTSSQRTTAWSVSWSTASKFPSTLTLTLVLPITLSLVGQWAQDLSLHDLHCLPVIQNVQPDRGNI